MSCIYSCKVYQVPHRRPALQNAESFQRVVEQTLDYVFELDV